MLHFVVILYLIFMSPMLAHAAMCGAGYYLADDDTCKICNISQGHHMLHLIAPAMICDIHVQIYQYL